MIFFTVIFLNPPCEAVPERSKPGRAHPAQVRTPWRTIPNARAAIYAHGAEYVRKTVAAAGLKLASCEEASPRTEDNEPVRGMVVVATKA